MCNALAHFRPFLACGVWDDVTRSYERTDWMFGREVYAIIGPPYGDEKCHLKELVADAPRKSQRSTYDLSGRYHLVHSLLGETTHGGWGLWWQTHQNPPLWKPNASTCTE